MSAKSNQARTATPADRAREERARRRRRRWAIGAMLFPLLFATVIAIGLAAMFYRRMEIFRPGHSSAGTPPCCAMLNQVGAGQRESAQR
ncbi:exported hypothetical protein [Burkholderiales bacterium]|nr:exported hypothetical protein [Burkholderiales bacterium]